MSFQEAIQYRTELHKLAELSGQEIKTAQYIQNKLEEMGFNVRSGVGGHGLVVDIDSGVAGPMVLMRQFFLPQLPKSAKTLKREKFVWRFSRLKKASRARSP